MSELGMNATRILPLKDALAAIADQIYRQNNTIISLHGESDLTEILANETIELMAQRKY